MDQKELEIREYFVNLLEKKIHSVYKIENDIFSDTYYFNDAYVIKDYVKEEIPLLSLERMKSVYEYLQDDKLTDKNIVIDEYHKRRVSKLTHGDIGYKDEPNDSQLRGMAKNLKKLHKHVSEYDIPMDIVMDLYLFKRNAKELISKVLENRIVREVKNIKDKTPIGLCHNLLRKENIIFKLDSVSIINYELSNINYTYFDLASFIHENLNSDASIKIFLSTYFGSTFNSLKQKRVELFISFVSLYYYYYYQYIYKLTKDDKYLPLIEKERRYLDSIK